MSDLGVEDCWMGLERLPLRDVSAGVDDVVSPTSASERRRGISVRRQMQALIPLGALWLVGLVVLAAARVQTAAPLRDLFLDPAHLTGAPWYTGALSNLGIFIWTAGVAFAAAGAWVARRAGRPEAARFLTVGAVATLILVMDDIFAVHSSVLNDIPGLPRSVAQLIVVSPALFWVVRYLGDIRRTRFVGLLAALGSLAASVLVDQSGLFSGDTSLLIEDGFKFLGILAWSQYFAMTARDIAASAITAHGQSASDLQDSGVQKAEAEDLPAAA